MKRAEIIALDKAHVWHPYTAMDGYRSEDPIVVARAAGCRFEDVDGTSYLDGNSSWWLMTLGHGHPRLKQVLRDQAETLLHVSLAGIAHEPSAALAGELLATFPGMSHVFYTDNGSGSVEVAVKMAAQYWHQNGHPEKTRFLALDGAFHGDTLGAASLGGVDVFRRPFANLLFDCVHAPIENDGYEKAFEFFRETLAREHGTIAAVVVEPLLQGAAGMRVYGADLLRELRALCTRYDVLLVCDEVFTGYGRTGPFWASLGAGVTPDLVCVGKAFTQLLPMGATLVAPHVEAGFRGGKDRAFYYGHTFCGHPLGAALAREVLRIYRDEKVLEHAARQGAALDAAFTRLADHPRVLRTRRIGMAAAADLAPSSGANGGYLGGVGWRVYQEARKRGAYIRPLGDTVYLTPPLVIDDRDLADLLAIFEESVRVVLQT